MKLTPFEIMEAQMEVIREAMTKQKPEMEKSHEYRTTELYAHDYRDMAMSEDSLMDMLEAFAEALQCDHQCSSNCRREGCNCACGEYHF